MVKFQSDVNAEYHKQLGHGDYPLEIALNPFRVTLEEMHRSYKDVVTQFSEMKEEFAVLNKKMKSIEARFVPLESSKKESS